MFDPHADPHGERTVRSQGAKSAADLILLEKKGRKALEYKDWKAPNQLVRSRSSSTDILWTLCGRRSRKTLRQKDYPAFPMARSVLYRPVSYTHLDVYKRQLIRISDLLLEICHRTLSFLM